MQSRVDLKSNIQCVMYTHIHTYLVITILQSGLRLNFPHHWCVNFISEWCDLQFKVDSEIQIFKQLFMAKKLTFHSFCQKSAEGKRGVTLNKLTHYLLDNGDFKIHRYFIKIVMACHLILGDHMTDIWVDC